MTKWIVSTQYMENYAEDGGDYWKAKGGSDYAVTAATAEEAERIVQEKKCHKTRYSEEYIYGATIPYDEWVAELKKSCKFEDSLKFWMESVETVEA
jgi:hypothetical protein